ncbi:MAG: Mrp/NBP35 family ATP-binding protein [Pseudomonadota bacterium]|nr:Mrp/NBP35 family ATP-binding protein [Pseudomonadota bacterium]MEC8026363.1 Mrp/NBP35 family ATP-binding protein [Pseudomonadota bacterium]
MTKIDEAGVLAALATVIEPDSGRDVVSLKMVSGLVVKDGNVGFSLEVDPARGEALEPLRQAAEAAVFALDGVSSVTAVLTAHSAGGESAAPAAAPRGDTGAGGGGARAPLLPDVGAIIAVASGKGGVGKSTVACNLALGLARLGLSVGLLDADIYGPSLPRMMGATGRPSTDDAGKTLIPMAAHGLKCMSIGFMVAEDSPMIWRGPMVMSALEQMLRDVAWGALDVLVVDMPPGTGDAQLTMAQRVPLAGAVIVSTPQDIALLDARKGLNMFRKVNVPVLGIVENMSFFHCPKCGERSDIFGHGGARADAEAYGVDFLGEVPLHMAIRSAGDGGAPIVVGAPESPEASAFMTVAAAVRDRLGAARKPAPSITFS